VIVNRKADFFLQKKFNFKFNFTNQVISVWNTLPDTVVSAITIDTFKARLDRFWSDQEVKYNWMSDIITGSRSQVSVIIEQEFVRPRWPYDMRPSARAEKYIRDAGP